MEADRRSTEAALKLMWEGLDQPRRGPRHRLTVEGLVEAARAVAEEGGVHALSMRAVAKRLGVGVATLYTYVPDKAALVALMSDTMVGQLPLPADRPGTWRERTEEWARNELAAFRANPWLLEFDDTHLIGPHGFAWMNSAVQVFDGTGLSPDEGLRVVDAVSGFVRGHIAPVIAEDQVRNWSGPEGELWSSVQEAFLATHTRQPGKFPALESITSHPHAEEAFESGLTWLLDGVELRMQQRADPTGA